MDIIENAKKLMHKRGFTFVNNNQFALSFKRISQGNVGTLQVYFIHEKQSVSLIYKKANHKFGDICDEIYLKPKDLAAIAKIAQDLYEKVL